MQALLNLLFGRKLRLQKLSFKTFQTICRIIVANCKVAMNTAITYKLLPCFNRAITSHSYISHVVIVTIGYNNYIPGIFDRWHV